MQDVQHIVSADHDAGHKHAATTYSQPIPQPCCMLGWTALQEMTRASALATAAPVPRGCAQPRRCFPARSNAPRGGRAGVTDVVQQFVAGLPADAAAAGAYLQREAGAASAVGGVAAAALAAAARAGGRGGRGRSARGGVGDVRDERARRWCVATVWTIQLISAGSGPPHQPTKW